MKKRAQLAAVEVLSALSGDAPARSRPVSKSKRVKMHWRFSDLTVSSDKEARELITATRPGHGTNLRERCGE